MSKEYFLLHNKGYDFWSYVYKSLYIQCYDTGYFLQTKEVYNKLTNYHDKDEYRLRSIINAIYNFLNGHKHSYSLEDLSESDALLAYELYVFALTYGYYPWDVANCPTGEEIAEYFLKHKAYPLIVPFVSKSHGTSQFTSLFLSDEIEYLSSQAFAKEMMPKVLSTMDVYEKARVKAIIKKLKHEKILPSKQIALAKKRKEREGYPYRGGQSDWQRIVGLILWDIWSETKEAEECDTIPIKKTREAFMNLSCYEEIEAIRVVNNQATEPYSCTGTTEKKVRRTVSNTEKNSVELDNLFEVLKSTSKEDKEKKIIRNRTRSILDVEDNTMRRWVTATLKSIEKGEYVKVKSEE